ncbi:hypothetical protein [Azospirillum endophyticum]|uniref:hypothetical protein n=1 Tax=Azospirillum endophyticum TaxID=2800326 RepID=UPI00200024A3|nr:hypothetical protein [Azospirillum endophyticum]
MMPILTTPSESSAAEAAAAGTVATTAMADSAATAVADVRAAERHQDMMGWNLKG